MNADYRFDRDVEPEIMRAREAQNAGNQGMARTAARRAVGAALKHWLEKYPHSEYPPDSMRQLRNFAAEKEVPPDVRLSLDRLQTRLDDSFESPSKDPVNDAIIICTYIRRLLE